MPDTCQRFPMDDDDDDLLGLTPAATPEPGSPSSARTSSPASSYVSDDSVDDAGVDSYVCASDTEGGDLTHSSPPALTPRRPQPPPVLVQEQSQEARPRQEEEEATSIVTAISIPPARRLDPAPSQRLDSCGCMADREGRPSPLDSNAAIVGHVHFAAAPEVITFDFAQDARMSQLRNRRAKAFAEANPNDMHILLDATNVCREQLAGNIAL